MISKENILKLELRRQIYTFILDHPGFHLREISRVMNITLGALRYHINHLKKQGHIITKIDSGYTRYYVPQKVAGKDKEILNLLRQDIPRKIILLLLLPGPGDAYKNQDIWLKAKKNPETHLKLYSKKELVELTKYWKGSNSDSFHLRKHRTTINFHLNKLLDAGLIEKVTVSKETKYKLKEEEMIWIFLFMNKDALSNKSINMLLSWRPTYVKDITNYVEKAVFEVFPHPYHA